MPYTWSGGGGPVGNRYFLSFYPLFLFLTPALRGFGSACVALAMGALFTAKIVVNPFYSSFNPGEHAKAGPLRWLPIELTLLNDLPVAAHAERSGAWGPPPVLAYFRRQRLRPRRRRILGEREGPHEVILRAPVVAAGGQQFATKVITHPGRDSNGETRSGHRVDRRESRTLMMQRGSRSPGPGR
jgi:hypothetical protein